MYPSIDALPATNRTLGDFTQDQWDALLRKPELVFARASPQDKLVIVSEALAAHVSYDERDFD